MRRIVTVGIIIILLTFFISGTALAYAESTWNAVEYSGHITAFFIQQTIPGWQAWPIPGNTTYYGMTVLLDNGTSIHVELNGRCIVPGFGIGSSVIIQHNTGLWNPSVAWSLTAPRAYYCQFP